MGNTDRRRHTVGRFAALVVAGSLLAIPGVSSAALTDGLFEPRVDHDAGPGASDVAPGDFNADGIVDLAVANANSGRVSILIGDGEGGFLLPRIELAAGAGTRAVAAADFNGDGRDDVVAANSQANSITVRLAGSGFFTGFRPGVTYPVGQNPVDVAVGDLNGDGDLDLAVANKAGNSISTLFGNGNGEFGPPSTRSPYAGPSSVAADDIDGDGLADLVTTEFTANRVAVRLASEATPSRYFAGADDPSDAALGDLDGDGDLDLVVALHSADRVAVLLGRGDGTFGSSTTHPVGEEPASVVLADFNADGDLDIATANRFDRTITVLLGEAGAGFGPRQEKVTGVGPLGSAVVDMDADGRIDLITANSGDNTVSVFDALPRAWIVATPSQVEFGPQSVGTSSAVEEVAIRNTGSGGDLYEANAVVTGADPDDFAIDGLTCAQAPPTPATECTLGVTFAPTAVGDRSAEIVITHPMADSSTSITLTGTATSAPPDAVDDAATVAEDSGPTAIDVLANDTNVAGGPMVVESVTQPANGTAAVSGDGAAVTYEPEAGYCNDDAEPDAFGYTLNGGSTASVAVTVECVDDAPVAVDDAVTVAEDSGPTAIDVLANDTDVDGGPMVVESVTQPDHGSVEIAGDGVDYEPAADYCNDAGSADEFSYAVNGGSTASVAVTVECVDDAPVAVDDVVTVAEDSGPTAVDVLANDTDVDGGPMVVESVTQPDNGTVAIAGDGTGVTYEPAADYCNDAGSANEFSYAVNGGSTASVAVTVECVDDAPVAVDDAVTVAEDSGTTAVDVLANDTDVDGGPMVVESVTQPDNGTVAITGDGTGVTYEPAADYCNDDAEPDTFTYTLNGGATASVAATVTCAPPPTCANFLACLVESLQRLLQGLAGIT